jgi:hypothetical protein
MLRLQPKPKVRHRVKLPSDLIDAMREVQRVIDEARRDPHVCIDYGDAIQVGPLCGGRSQKRRPSRFEFLYRPPGEHDARWHLKFFDFDIEDIAGGHVNEMTLYCCTSPNCGFKANTADDHCGCDYVRDPDFGTFRFPEALEKLKQRGVCGISENSTRDDVIAVLGPPDKTGGDVTVSSLYIGPWITYHRDDCQLHFAFGKDGSIENVTVLTKDWKPGC